MQSLICPNCGYQSKKKEMFCCKCGTKMVTKSCLACGKELNPNDLFCTQCGTKRDTKQSAAQGCRSSISALLLRFAAMSIPFALYSGCRARMQDDIKKEIKSRPELQQNLQNAPWSPQRTYPVQKYDNSDIVF